MYWHVLFVCVVGALTPAYGSAGSSATAAEEMALDDAVQAWRRLGVEDYAFDFQNLCNCAAGATARMRVIVTGGKIASVTYAEPVFELHQDKSHRDIFHKVAVADMGSTVPAEFSENLGSISELLEEMKRQIYRPLARYEAEFDAEIGVPCRIFYDFSGALADDELEILISNFELNKKATIPLGCAGEGNELSGGVIQQSARQPTW